MTISESIITWLQGYEEIKISTDRLESAPVAYGLTKVPEHSRHQDVVGDITYTDSFQFAAKLMSQTEQTRIRNQAWFEGLSDWIDEQAAAGNYPALREPLICEDLEASQVYYMGQDGEDAKSSIYVLTISITYRKE